MPQPADHRDESSWQPRWYQTTIRELLLVTTLAALTLSVLKTFGVRNLVAVGVALFPLGLDVLVLGLRLRAQCKAYGIWDLPLVATAGPPGSSAEAGSEAQPCPLAKREAFLPLVADFVGRSGLYLDGDTACLVRVERVIASSDRVHVRLRPLPGLRLIGKLVRALASGEVRMVYREEDCPLGPCWEVSQTWRLFEFSDTVWDSSAEAGWRLSFSKDLMRRFMARNTSWLDEYVESSGSQQPE